MFSSLSAPLTICSSGLLVWGQEGRELLQLGQTDNTIKIPVEHDKPHAAVLKEESQTPVLFIISSLCTTIHHMVGVFRKEGNVHDFRGRVETVKI